MRIISYIFSATVLVMLQCAAQAQIDVKSISALIQSGNYELAAQVLDACQEQNPMDPDVYMLKGNLEVFSYLGIAEVVLEPETDLNPFEAQSGFISSAQSRTIPDEISRRATAYYAKALELDPSREDIHLGTCHVMSIALRTDDLLAYLPTLKQHITLNGPAYSMANYARNIMERGDFNGGIRVYRKIFELYPEEHGVLSDIAGEFFLHGQTDSAEVYCNRVLAYPQNDVYTLGTCHFILGMLGREGRALQCARDAQALQADYDYLFYQALLQWSAGDQSWKTPALLGMDYPMETDTYKGCDLMLATMNEKERYEKLLALPVADHYKLLIHRKYLRDGSDRANYGLAETYAYQKLYAQSLPWFEKLKKSKAQLNPQESEWSVMLHAWCLHELGRKNEALPLWKKTSAMQLPYVKSAGLYFTALYAYEAGDKAAALAACQKAIELGVNNKYVNFATALRDKINGHS